MAGPARRLAFSAGFRIEVPQPDGLLRAWTFSTLRPRTQRAAARLESRVQRVETCNPRRGLENCSFGRLPVVLRKCSSMPSSYGVSLEFSTPFKPWVDGSSPSALTLDFSTQTLVSSKGSGVFLQEVLASLRGQKPAIAEIPSQQGLFCCLGM